MFNVLEIKKQKLIDYPLTAILRHETRILLAAAMDAEIDACLAEYVELKTSFATTTGLYPDSMMMLYWQ